MYDESPKKTNSLQEWIKPTTDIMIHYIYIYTYIHTHTYIYIYMSSLTFKIVFLHGAKQEAGDSIGIKARYGTQLGPIRLADIHFLHHDGMFRRHTQIAKRKKKNTLTSKNKTKRYDTKCISQFSI